MLLKPKCPGRLLPGTFGMYRQRSDKDGFETTTNEKLVLLATSLTGILESDEEKLFEEGCSYRPPFIS